MVEAFLAQDAGFASILRKVSGAVRRPEAAIPPPDERRVVEATRRRLGRQRWILGAAVAATLTPFAFRFSEHGSPSFLFDLGRLSLVLGVLLPLALVLWWGFWRSTRP
jgi:hypothetical protein